MKRAFAVGKATGPAAALALLEASDIDVRSYPLPVLELDEGIFVRESTAICTYLAEDRSLFPADKFTRARILEWMGFEQTHVDGVISRARFRRMYPNVIATREEEFDAWLAEGRDALRLLDAHLERREFLVGDGFSLADIALYAYTHVADQGGFELGRYPALRAWFSRVEAQPGFLPIDRRPA